MFLYKLFHCVVAALCAGSALSYFIFGVAPGIVITVVGLSIAAFFLMERVYLFIYIEHFVRDKG